jgi:NADPH-dependent glutamate synthase beta subunit-like oxidoreductase
MPRVDDPNLLVNENDFPNEDYHCDDPEKAKLVAKLGRMITDYIPRQLGGVKPNNVDFWILDRLLTKDEVKFMLSFRKKRVPYTMEQLAERNKMSLEDTQKMVKHLLWIGILEQNRDNKDHHLQYLVPLWVVGSGEYMMENPTLADDHHEVATMFNLVPQEPVSITSYMVPPGGAGLGMHVIPVEKAIEHESTSVSVEHLSHWLDKYDKFCTMVCACRKAQRIRGEGVGDIEGQMCIGVGDIAEFLVESGKDAHYVSREKVKEILERSERKGYVHQITNLDGENRIVGICNCSPGSCYALRTSQLFNTPNMSRSAYRAHVDKSKCVACGKCVEVCPSGAAKLGQKLCHKDGREQVYPLHELPDDHKWGPDKWDRNYRDNNKINCWPQGTSPCKTACPSHIAVQGYVKMAADGKYADAVKLIRQDNPFPAVCGMVCNHRCEDRCTRGTIDQPVAIDEIKKFLTLHEMDNLDQFVPVCDNDEGKQWSQYPIAVIGAGPAGMTAAYYLRKSGYPVTVFEKENRPGGMLMNGIPSFRLEKKYIEAEISILRKMGIEFKCGVEVGKDITIESLRKEGYKAFYIAIGLQGGRMAGVEGEDAYGVESGVSFLRRINQDHTITLDGDVVVVGGGNVAVDVARSALRAAKGAKVTMLCLENTQEMPASKEEVDEAKAEGIEVKNGWGPKEILTKDGKVTGIIFKRCLSVRDKSGRFNPQYDEDDTITIDCANVLLAIGQSAEWGSLLEGTKVKLRRNGTAEADPVTFQTAEPDIFVGGDISHGARFAIDAIADGREGMVSINRFVHPGQSLTIGRDRREFIEFDRDDIQVESFDNARRAVPGVRPGDAKSSFEDFRLPLTEAQVRQEANRCLHCGATTVDLNKCIGCGLCTTRCEFDAIHLSRDIPEASRMVKAEDKMKYILPYAAKRALKIKFGKKK